MKVGDLVRFAKWEELTTDQMRNSKNWCRVPKIHFGVLVDRNLPMGNVQVLHEGKVLGIRSVFVEKAGRKDYEKNKKLND